MSRKKDALIFILKFLISLSLISYLLLKIVPLKEIPVYLSQANLFLLFLSFSLHSIGLLISAYRWQILIHAQGDHVPLGFLAKSYLVGTFFNNFLPTRFGGDVVRILDGSRYSRSILKSSAIVLVERLTGIIVLLFLALVSSLIRMDMSRRIPLIFVSFSFGLLGICALLSLFTPLAGHLFLKIPERGRLLKIKTKILEFRNLVLLYKDRKKEVSKAFFWAFLLQVNVILHYFLAGEAFKLKITLLDYFVFIPIVLIILTFPISISGLGIREGMYIEIFKFYSISPASAFTFSLVADMLFSWIIGIVGGIIYIFRK